MVTANESRALCSVLRRFAMPPPLLLPNSMPLEINFYVTFTRNWTHNSKISCCSRLDVNSLAREWLPWHGFGLWRPSILSLACAQLHHKSVWLTIDDIVCAWGQNNKAITDFAIRRPFGLITLHFTPAYFILSLSLQLFKACSSIIIYFLSSTQIEAALRWH